MRVFRSDAHINHMPVHEFYDGILIPPFESAERAHIIDRALDTAGFASETTLTPVPDDILARIHTRAYLNYLATIYPRWCSAGGAVEAVLPSTLAVRWMNRYSPHPLAEPGYYAFDLSAPIVAGTWAASLDAASMAYSAAQAIIDGAPLAYARCRPPGHHAGSDMCGGYCYINNAAIAAETLRVRGRVAILDIDIHHGNGTQQIFYERNDVTFVSIHGHPDVCYPYFLGFADETGAGLGTGHNCNIPLAFGSDDATYLDALDQALVYIHQQQVTALVISAGFDTYGGDPLGGFALTRECYRLIGQRCMALGLPVVVIQEGGYAIDALGDNLVALLHGMTGV
ncbi:MAG: histone deacetylase family protein [Roseiflexaceae bacterium]